MLRTLFRKIGDLMIWASGVDTEALDAVPSERNKVVGVGSAVVVTGLVATIAASSLARLMIDGIEWRSAIVIGLFWGGIILAIDRWLVATVHTHHGRASQLPGQGPAVGMGRRIWWAVTPVLGLLPRLALTVVLSLVIAEPLILTVFHDEIELEMQEMASERADEFERQLNADERFVVIPELEAEIADLHDRANGLTTDRLVADAPEVVDLTERLDALQTKVLAAHNAFLCEWNGANGQRVGGTDCGVGTGIPGCGPVCESKKAEWQRLVEEEHRLEDQLVAARNNASQAASTARNADRETARDELDAKMADLVQRRSERDERREAFTAKNENSTGLLARIGALGRIQDDDGNMRAAVWVLRGFLFALDALPVLVKMTMLLGPLTPLDREIQQREERHALRSRADLVAERIQQDAIIKRLELDTDASLEVAEQEKAVFQDHERQLFADKLAQQRDAELTLHQAVVNEWLSRQLDEMNDDFDSYIGG